jgi:hypothetical protein
MEAQRKHGKKAAREIDCAASSPAFESTEVAELTEKPDCRACKFPHNRELSPAGSSESAASRRDLR